MTYFSALAVFFALFAGLAAFVCRPLYRSTKAMLIGEKFIWVCAALVVICLFAAAIVDLEP